MHSHCFTSACWHFNTSMSSTFTWSVYDSPLRRGWWWSYIKHGGQASDRSAWQGFNFCKGHTPFREDMSRYFFCQEAGASFVTFLGKTWLSLSKNKIEKEKEMCKIYCSDQVEGLPFRKCFKTFLLLPYNLVLLYRSKKHHESFLCLPILMCHVFFLPVNIFWIDQQV